MDRLTRRELWWGSQGKTDKAINYKVDEERRCVTHEGSSDFLIADKLAEYEDLEERLNAVYGECDGILEIVVEHLERHENVDIPEPVFKARLLTDGEVDRWEKFKDLEEQGKLLKMPCEIGHRVHMIYQFCGEGAWEIEEHKIRLEDLENIGKTIFLTRQEAEDKLAEMEGKNGN